MSKLTKLGIKEHWYSQEKDMNKIYLHFIREMGLEGSFNEFLTDFLITNKQPEV